MLHQTPVLSSSHRVDDMASEAAPSWADQWGAGGIGAMEDEGMRSQKGTTKNKGEKGNFGAKAKVGVMVGVQKMKSTTSWCVKWIKQQCKRKNNASN
ncbi:uncharacterized protein G2W53_032149 [Senna tora]|uniref:Uncharacterized protein n=1 Tax=Senna tora TaxID=362788 RepID=A0A834W7F0_9FABA|nr:uncharacterized protein G2W53_032149 [Senna tora]